jgi:uncharacterized protein
MEKKINIPGEIALSIGVLLTSFAVTLMVRANFGISTMMSLPYVLSRIFAEVSFGTWNLIFQTCLLVTLVTTTRRFKSGYVISIVFAAAFGFVLDLFANALIGLPGDLTFRVFYFMAGYLLVCVAISFMIGSKVPIMITDSFIHDLAIHFKVTFGRLKTLFDIVYVTFAVCFSMAFMGGLVGVGIGTVIMACITGSGVHAATNVLRRMLVIEPWSKRLGDMAK